MPIKKRDQRFVGARGGGRGKGASDTGATADKKRRASASGSRGSIESASSRGSSPVRPGKHAKKQAKDISDAAAKMDENGRKQLLGWMNSRTQKETPEETRAKEESRQVYTGLPSAKKIAFVERWKASKKNKNFDWVRDYQEEMQKRTDYERDSQIKQCTRPRVRVYICIYIYIIIYISIYM